ncbi:hypothetical protein [Vacuolonema iberomarrocanum]|uniref:hypothetical protein n=1 Tax=Vacuolonema iberomarrocanum TaxID=3454632 RepID=UPI0019DB83E6|nr:hypothetical protein [filamentous cyanobacterium LEGE 07170]
MPTKLLEGFGAKLVDQWGANLLTPAFVFWLGGLLAWGDRQNWDWSDLTAFINGLEEPIQIAVLFIVLLVIIASGFVIQRFDLAVLRLFEGYWPPFLTPVRRWFLRRQHARFDRLDRRWQTLIHQKYQTALTPRALEDLAALEEELRQFPSDRDRLMPTRLGNLLRAAESRPGEKYGLDAIICWPRLWLLLPDKVKQELQTARADLNTAARLWLWGVLFILWVFMGAWWPVLVGGSVAVFSYNWMLQAAEIYGSLLESAFDLHRMALYAALHFPLPTHPAEEQVMGKAVTEYLWRGSDRPQPEFRYPK